MRRSDTEDYNERKDKAPSPRMAKILQRGDQSEQQESQQEERPQQQEQDEQQQQRYRQQHHHHHHRRTRHHHPTPHPACGACTCQLSLGIALHDVCEACLRSKFKRSEYSPRSHRQRGNHSHSIDVHDDEDRNHDTRGNCNMHVNDTNQDVCSKCHGSTNHSTTVANCDNICPMCTLANETGKLRCELCGFHLPV